MKNNIEHRTSNSQHPIRRRATRLLFLLTLSLTHLLTYSAEAELAAEEAEESFYKAGEFSIDLFGTVRTKDFDNERTGVGAGVNYFFTQQFGLGIEGSGENTSGAFVDAARVNLIYRIPIGRTAPYLFMGGGRNFDIRSGEGETPHADRWGHRGDLRDHDTDDNSDDEWAVNFGAGVEHRFSERFGVFADARLDKVLDHSATALARIGIRIRLR